MKNFSGNSCFNVLLAFIILAIICLAAIIIYQQYNTGIGQNINEPNYAPIHSNNPSQNQPASGEENFSNKEENNSAENACLNSGGAVLLITCYCANTSNFFNSCLMGGCACTPDPEYARQIKVCECGEGKCFNGQQCVGVEVGI